MVHLHAQFDRQALCHREVGAGLSNHTRFRDLLLLVAGHGPLDALHDRIQQSGRLTEVAAHERAEVVVQRLRRTRCRCPAIAARKTFDIVEAIGDGLAAHERCRQIGLIGSGAGQASGRALPATETSRCARRATRSTPRAAG